MVETKLDRLLAKAEEAFDSQDRRQGGRLVNDILQQDFNHQGAWELLYRIYGGQRDFRDFQRTFIQRYYPTKLSQLGAAGGANSPEPEIVKVSLFGRMLRSIKRAGEQAVAPNTADSTLVSSAAPPVQVKTREDNSVPKRVSLQPPQRAPDPETPPSAPDRQPKPAPETNQTLPPERPVRVRQSGIVQSGKMMDKKVQQGTLMQTAAGPDAGVDTTGKIRVMIADDIAETRNTIARTLRFQEDIVVVGTASDGTEAVELANQLQPDVIVMDVNMPDMDGITATALIKKTLPATQIVILTVQDDIDYIRRAMLAGARDYLTKPPTIDELIQAIQKSSEFSRREKAQAPRAAAAAAATQMAAQNGKIITLYSPRGGAGCTMLAANLAAFLYSEEMPVVIVDGNLQFGDVAVFFNAQSKKTILDLSLRAEDLDPGLIEEVAIRHSSGIQMLAPPPPEFAERVRADKFARMLSYLSGMYAYVIVDTACTLTDVTLSTLEISDLTVMVTTQDIPSIARARKFLNLAFLLGLDPIRILAVMNHYNNQVKISPQKVEEALGMALAATIPIDNATVVPSVNRGAPFMLQEEMSSRAVSTAVKQMSEAILEQLQKLDQLEDEEKEAGKPALLPEIKS